MKAKLQDTLGVTVFVMVVGNEVMNKGYWPTEPDVVVWHNTYLEVHGMLDPKLYALCYLLAFYYN